MVPITVWQVELLPHSMRMHTVPVAMPCAKSAASLKKQKCPCQDLVMKCEHKCSPVGSLHLCCVWKCTIIMET